MKLERSFFQNGRVIKLEELQDLIALRLPNSEKLKLSANAQQSSEPQPNGIGHRETASRFNRIAPEVSLPQVRAFEDAGWQFLSLQDSLEAINPATTAKVFVKSGGRLALGTNKLVVKLHEDVSEERANEILQPFDCRVIEKLRFGSGLFRVQTNENADTDALNVANQLMAAKICQYAEPELLEINGAR